MLTTWQKGFLVLPRALCIGNMWNEHDLITWWCQVILTHYVSPPCNAVLRGGGHFTKSFATCKRMPGKTYWWHYFPVTSLSGTHQDTLVWNASQTTWASGLSDRIAMRLGGRLHLYLVLSPKTHFKIRRKRVYHTQIKSLPTNRTQIKTNQQSTDG